MPLYVHEVDATIAPPGQPTVPEVGHGMPPAQFAALVDAVASELARRARDAESLRAETRITGTNRAPGE